MTVLGAEPDAHETIRRACPPNSIQLFNVTSLRISHDGRRFDSCDTAKLHNVFQRAKGRVWIELENAFDHQAEPIRLIYDVEFRAASAQDLDAVDRSFVHNLARADPTVGHVQSFIRSCPTGAVDDYVQAMANYVLGILMKDGDPASGIHGLRDYRPKLNSALRTLQDYDRPLPRLLAALIRFSSNDFSCWWETTGIELLDSANDRLGRLTRVPGDPGPSEHSNARAEGMAICPIDNGTDTVMRRADHLKNVVRWGEQLDDQLRAEIEQSRLERLDQLKIAALWAERAIALDRPRHASEPLGMLLGDHCFGAWADATLEGLANG